MAISTIDESAREWPITRPVYTDSRGREIPIALRTVTDAQAREIPVFTRAGGLIKSAASDAISETPVVPPIDYLADGFALTGNFDNAYSSGYWNTFRDRIASEISTDWLRSIREAVSGPVASGGSWTIPTWLSDFLDPDICPWAAGKTLMLQLNAWGRTLGTPNFGGKRIDFATFRASTFANNWRYCVWRIFQDIPPARVANIAVSNEPENYPLPGSYEKWVPDYIDDLLTTTTSLTLSATSGSSVTATAGSSLFAANDAYGEIRGGAGFGAIVGYVSPTQVSVTNFGAFTADTFASDAWSIAGRGKIATTLTLSDTSEQSGGTAQVVTAGASVFSAADVGSYIFGGVGRATITSASGTTATLNVLEPFAVTTLTSGKWHKLGKRSPNGVLDAMDRLIRTMYLGKEQLRGINCPTGMVNGDLGVSMMGPLIARPAGGAIQYGTYSQMQLYTHDAGINGPGDLADSVDYLSDHQHNVNTRIDAWDGSWGYAFPGDLSMYHSAESKAAMNAARVAAGLASRRLLLANDEAGVAHAYSATTNQWAGELQQVSGAGRATVLSVATDGSYAEVLVTTAFTATTLTSAQWTIPSYVASPTGSITLSGTSTGVKRVTSANSEFVTSLGANIEALCSYRLGPHLLGLKYYGVYLWCHYALCLSAATTDFNMLESFGWSDTWPSRDTWTFVKNNLIDYRIYDIGDDGKKILTGTAKPWAQFNRLHNGCVYAAVNVAPTATPFSGNAPFAEWRRVTMTADKVTLTEAPATPTSTSGRNMVSYLVYLRHLVQHKVTVKINFPSGGSAAQCAVRIRGYDNGDQYAESVQTVNGLSTAQQTVTVLFTPAFGQDAPNQKQPLQALVCIDHNADGQCEYTDLVIEEDWK